MIKEELEIKDIYGMGAMNVAGWMDMVSLMPNTPDIIEQLLSPQQIMLLCGQFQIGKTNELLHLYFSFIHEGCQWHGLEIAPCPVLYIGWEGNPRKVANRLNKIKAQYKDKREVYPGYFKMIDHKVNLNTVAGREEYVAIISKLTPKPSVILLDPFKRTVQGNYSIPDVAESWIVGASSIARDSNTSIIAAHHTNKIVYQRGQSEDTLSADKVKGAKDLLDGVNSALLFGEERGSRRVKDKREGEEYSKVVWATLNNVIKVLKAKDADVQTELPMLKVNFNRQQLRLTGQRWEISEGNVRLVDDTF